MVVAEAAEAAEAQEDSNIKFEDRVKLSCPFYVFGESIINMKYCVVVKKLYRSNYNRMQTN